MDNGQERAWCAGTIPILSTSDFQSEVGGVFGEIGGELPAKFGRRFSSFFYWGKSSEAFSTKTPPQTSPSNFTTRFWVVAGPTILSKKKSLREFGLNFGVQAILRVAPRVAQRIGFSHKLGRECHSKNCSENTPEFRELL